MILFSKDWDKYPSATVHRETKNKSFLEMSSLLAEMGIKNNCFHLALLQDNLRYVDPHDKNLSEDIKVQIILECRHNPWYHFREVSRVPAQAGAAEESFRANRGNLAAFWLYFNHIDFCLIQPRQTGKSFSIDTLATYLIYVAMRNSYVSALTKDNELRVANVERIKAIRDTLPPYLNSKTRSDCDNTHMIECKKYDNTYSTNVSQNSESSANNLGRGLTSPTMLIDEPPFINYMDLVIPAMLSSGNAARDKARDAGAYYGNIFTTTAGKINSRSGKYIYDMFNGGMVWTERIYDCEDMADAHRLVDLSSTGQKPMVNITMSHRQLGYTDEWLYEKLRNSNSKGEEADRDYFNIWTAGGLSSPLTTQLNEIIKKSNMEPKHIEISKQGYTLRWYIPEAQIKNYMENNQVVMGIDSSEGIGRDSLTLVMLNAKNLEVIAASNINETMVIRYAYYICDLMVKYKNITVIPERKSTGLTIIETMLEYLPSKGIDPFRRIYNTLVDDGKHLNEANYRFINQGLTGRNPSLYESTKKHFGFATAGSGRFSRTSLYENVLQTAARSGGTMVRDSRLINEINTLTVKDGRLDHANGGNDDMVIAWLLPVWMLMHSKNLNFYGIKGALTEVVEYREAHQVQKPLSAYENYQKEKQDLYRMQMSQLLDKIEGCRDDSLIRLYEGEIRNLNTKLTEDFIEALTITQVIEQAKEQRARTMREKQAHRNRFVDAFNFDYA